jgi:hypothetical protein
MVPALQAQKQEFAEQLQALKVRMEATAGRLPVATAWAPDTVTYQGSFVVHEGSACQAVKDATQRPGGTDWVLIARAARDGRDSREMGLRGAFDLRDAYSVMDVVAYEGQGYIATRENPGVPGVDDGWLLIAARGEGRARGAGIARAQRRQGSSCGKDRRVADQPRAFPRCPVPR